MLLKVFPNSEAGRILAPQIQSPRSFFENCNMPFPVDVKWIAKTEKKLGTRLPSSYVTAMVKMNGGSVVSRDGTWSLFPIFDGSDRKRIQRTCSSVDRESFNARETRYDFPPKAVVIGENGCGDLLVLLPMPDAPENLQHDIYLWDHETSETSHLADDFADMPKTA